MDNVMWVVIAAAVVISLAGVVLYIGSTSLGDFEDSGDDIEEDYTEDWSPDNENNQNEGNDDESEDTNENNQESNSEDEESKSTEPSGDVNEAPWAIW